MSKVDRLTDTLVAHRRLVLVVMLVLTLAVGAGAGQIESSNSIGTITSDSTAVEKYDYVQENFSARDGNTTTALFAVRNSDGNVLSRDSLLRSLRFQQDIRGNETLNETLVSERPTIGIANIVARVAILTESRQTRAVDQSSRGGNATGGSESAPTAQPPSIDEQIEQLEAMNATEVERLVGRLLAEDNTVSGSQAAIELLPREYEAGTTTANARQVVVTFRTEKEIREPGTISEPVVEGHVVARDIAKAQQGPESYLTFGAGYIPEQLSKAVSDSFAIIGPAALVFVFLVLSLAYRDLLDIGLGLLGIVLVLVWTFGLMGWAGIPFNQVMIAVPILLIGLSVDYALHVFMRYRERRSEDDNPTVAEGMSSALGGVGTALVLVTVTTSIGFLANVTSPVGDMRDFGILTTFGIVSALVVFGVIVPALKVSIDGVIEARGYDRSKPAFGSGKRLEGLLSVGATLARRAPIAVLAIALLTTAAGAYGATGIDASFTEESVMADEPPAWSEQLPSSLQPGEFYLKDNREYIFSQFQTPDKQIHLLFEGDVTQAGTLQQVESATSTVNETDVTFVRDGEAVVETPLTAMERTARRNATFNQTFHAADSDGDGVPDQNLTAVYDGFYGAAPDLAGRFLHKTDGQYASLRIGVAVDGGAEPTIIHQQMSDIAGDIETDERTQLTVTATGQPIVSKQSDELLANAVVEGLAVTIVSLLVLLTIVFRLSEGSASLGTLTIFPVLMSVAWLLGTMAILDIPFSFVTSVVGSIALGLGIDYSIHVSERFAQELERHDDPIAALERTVRGTGGALLSSATTTAVGFGVLALALLPALQRFGFILAMGVVYSFLASVIVFPSLLALWETYVATPGRADPEAATVPSDD